MYLFLKQILIYQFYFILLAMASLKLFLNKYDNFNFFSPKCDIDNG